MPTPADPRPFGSAEQVAKNLAHIRGCDWCLRRAAKTPSALLPDVLRKQVGGHSATPRKEIKEMTKKQIRKNETLLKALGINLAGSGSTAADRQSSGALSQMINRAATSQTREVHAREFAHFDARVAAAKSAFENARNEYDRGMARNELENASRARFMAKMIARDNARARGQLPPGRFGPNSTDLFSGSSLTLPEDRQVHGI